MQEIKLPQTLSELKHCFQVNSDYDVVNLVRNPAKLSPSQEKIWKYCGPALLAGRSMDSTIIALPGESGAGKTTTLNSLFCDDELCKTNDSESETNKIVFVRKLLHVTEEDPAVLTELNFVDMPGFFDTNDDNEKKNRDKICKFKLAERTDIPLPFRKCYSIRTQVYPNLVLLVVNAFDNRMGGKDSQLMKALRSLKEDGKIVDTKNSNLIVVLTHVMSLARADDAILQILKKRMTIITQAVKKVFDIDDVDIVPIENKPVEYQLPKEGDYYKLPNGQLSHYNLFQAMINRLNTSGDLLAKLCLAWYSNTHCEDRKKKAEIVDIDNLISIQPPDEVGFELVEYVESFGDDIISDDVSDMSSMSTSMSSLDLRAYGKMCQFQSLGYGFCPVTEQVKPFSPLQLSDKVDVEVEKSKFIIPKGIEVYSDRKRNFHFRSFFKKEDYESHMRDSYGLEVGIKLVVKGSSDWKWVDDGGSSQQQFRISTAQEIRVATLKLPDPCGHPRQARFQRALESLPDEYNEEDGPKYRSFFSKWGSHLVIEQGIGGNMQLNCTINEQSVTRDKFNEIKIKVSAIMADIFTTVGSQNTLSKNVKALRKVGLHNETLDISGGDPPNLFTLEALTAENLIVWSESVASNPSEICRTIKLEPYYNLIEGKKSDALRKATEDYLKNSQEKKEEEEFRRNKIAKDLLDDVIDTPPGRSCFPKGTMCTLVGEKSCIPIENLDNHSALLTVALKGNSNTMKHGNICKTKFCTFLDAKQDVKMDFIALNFTNHKKLLVSEGHMIFQYLPEKDVIIGKQAKYFQVGDRVVYTTSPATNDSPVEYPVIASVGIEKHLGAYSPLTMSGTFLADGFLVSSYANVNSFKVAQYAMAPLKLWCSAMPFKMLKSHKKPSNENGIHVYAKFLASLRKNFTGYNKK